MKIDAPILVLFDGVCNLCNGAVQFIIKRDRKNRFKFASLQSTAGIQQLKRLGLDPNSLHSIIVIEGDNFFERSDAALRIARHLGSGWAALQALKIFPRFFRDGLYNIVARNRYKFFGKRDECMLPTPETKERFIS